jgi:hypothetical protein
LKIGRDLKVERRVEGLNAALRYSIQVASLSSNRQ